MSIRTLALFAFIGGFPAAAHACYDEQIFEECLWMCMTSRAGLPDTLSEMINAQRQRFAR
jgi:hypothetical protein